MKDFAPKIAERVAGDLEPGERLLAAVRTQSVASAAAAGGAGGAAGAAGGAAGLAVVAALLVRDAVRGQQPAELTEEAMRLATLGATERRLLVWQRSRWTGRTGDLLGAFPRERLRRVSGGRGRLAHQLELEFVDGQSVVLEVFRGDDVEHFASALS